MCYVELLRSEDSVLKLNLNVNLIIWNPPLKREQKKRYERHFPGVYVNFRKNSPATFQQEIIEIRFTMGCSFGSELGPLLNDVLKNSSSKISSCPSHASSSMCAAVLYSTKKLYSIGSKQWCCIRATTHPDFFVPVSLPPFWIRK